MTILETILLQKRKELTYDRELVPVSALERSRFFKREPLSLSRSLSDSSKTGIIAEFKRRSPSKGIINSESDIIKVTAGYRDAGASGLSVLTDQQFFGGNLNDLRLTREMNSLPVLRKDFILDSYQVLESKASGADAILLIASALGRKEILELASLSHSLGMEVLLEVHSYEELEKTNEYIDIIGVNNRNLQTFEVDISTSYTMADKIPGSVLKISESGISSAETLKGLLEVGYNGFLIGELFMGHKDPVSSFVDFVRKIHTGNA